MNSRGFHRDRVIRLAATVMLLRPGSERFQVFMLRRSARSAFAPDAFVFPGGTIEPQDKSEPTLARMRGLDPGRLGFQFRSQPAPGLASSVPTLSLQDAAGLTIAGLRELYEEAGVLLACDAAAHPVSLRELQPHAERLRNARGAVATGRLDFAALLNDLDLFGNGAALQLFSRWITPPDELRRYDAHFFVAAVEPEQTALADAHETHDGIWIEPQAALRRMHDGNFRMVYPTIKHIERLARFTQIDDLLAFTRNKPIYSIMPTVSLQAEIGMPSELEYSW